MSQVRETLQMGTEAVKLAANSAKSVVNGAVHGDFPTVGKSGRPLYTTSGGHPVTDDNNSVTIGESGTLSLEDFHLLNKLAHFNRERVPERVVHAKGAGAHGTFTVTGDVTDLCKAKLLQPGATTPVFARFSTVTGESGFADTARDPRGFSLKFYTDEGNWDMVGNNTPVFFIRDPSKFPDLIHSQKRHPQSHLKHPDSFWDFLSLVPESIHQVLITFSPRGVPDGFRHMNGYGSHTFKWINAEGKAHWVKYHFHSDQGIKNLSEDKAVEIAGIDPDYSTRDLQEAISAGNYPSWTFYVQVMSLDDAPKYKFDPFDLTKVWSKKDYPLREVGKLVLNRLSKNYFAEVEQASFSPAHMPPGIEASPDRILQSRLFAYDDAARYRIGANYLHVPINRCPFKAQNYERDGAMNCTDNGLSEPNYYPNSFPHLPQPDPSYPDVHPYMHEGGIVGRHIPTRWTKEDIYEQPRDLWNLLSEKDKKETVKNIGGHLGLAMKTIQQRMVKIFESVDPELGGRVQEEIINAENSSKPPTVVA